MTRFSLPIALAILLATHQTAFSQVLYGSIVGTIEDPSGAVVPNAAISLTNSGTSATREIKADEQGRYTAASLSPGTYSLKIIAPGFRTTTRTGIAVTINNITRAEIRLEVGQLAEQVTVSATTATLQTDRSDVRAEFASKTIVELPLNNYRNYQSMIKQWLAERLEKEG